MKSILKNILLVVLTTAMLLTTTSCNKQDNSSGGGGGGGRGAEHDGSVGDGSGGGGGGGRGGEESELPGRSLLDIDCVILADFGTFITKHGGERAVTVVADQVKQVIETIMENPGNRIHLRFSGTPPSAIQIAPKNTNGNYGYQFSNDKKYLLDWVDNMIENHFMPKAKQTSPFLAEMWYDGEFRIATAALMSYSHYENQPGSNARENARKMVFVIGPGFTTNSNYYIKKQNYDTFYKEETEWFELNTKNLPKPFVNYEDYQETWYGMKSDTTMSRAAECLVEASNYAMFMHDIGISVYAIPVFIGLNNAFKDNEKDTARMIATKFMSVITNGDILDVGVPLIHDEPPLDETADNSNNGGGNNNNGGGNNNNGGGNNNNGGGNNNNGGGNNNDGGSNNNDDKNKKDPDFFNDGYPWRGIKLWIGLVNKRQYDDDYFKKLTEDFPKPGSVTGQWQGPPWNKRDSGPDVRVTGPDDPLAFMPLSLSLEKFGFTPVEKMIANVQGLTPSMLANGVVVSMYGAGAAHEDYKELQKMQTSYALLEFTAPSENGFYELRLYIGGDYNDDTLTLSVPFIVSNEITEDIE